jgi:GMP synthase (glutamine-hydrolysing)
LILDFGSQYTQLIARRVRELSVYCEIVPYWSAMEKVRTSKPTGIILSGGPDSVFKEGSPSLPAEFFNSGIPTLGICYGLMLMSQILGGRVIPGGDRREFGKATVEVREAGSLFMNIPNQFQGWMSHGDRVVQLARISLIGGVEASCRCSRRIPSFGANSRSYSPLRQEIIENFIVRICQCKCDWTMAAFIESTVAALEEKSLGQNSAFS